MTESLRSTTAYLLTYIAIAALFTGGALFLFAGILPPSARASPDGIALLGELNRVGSTFFACALIVLGISAFVKPAKVTA